MAGTWAELPWGVIRTPSGPALQPLGLHCRSQMGSSMWFLRQSTAGQELPLGPFVSSADGNTPQTGLTIANTDVRLQKAGTTAEVGKSSGGATHIASGRYYAVLDATDTDTVGPLRVSVHVGGALAVWLDCCVLAPAVYDTLFGTADPRDWTANERTAIRSILGVPASGTAPADPTVGILDEIRDTLTGGPIQVTVTSPVAETGAVEVFIGDSYQAADGRALQWAATGWPDLTGASITFEVHRTVSPYRAVLQTAGVVTVAGAATQEVRVELTGTLTAGLVRGNYDYEVVATLASGGVLTLVRGPFYAKGEV